MSNKDTAKDILSGVISDVVERKESEPSKLEASINLYTSQLELSVIGGDTTERTNMASKDEQLAMELEEQKRMLYLQMKEIEETGNNLTENKVHMRNLRAKMKLISDDLRITLEKNQRRKV